MKINSLYRDYIQKSRLFLYPLLEIKRGVSVTPIQTYMSWRDKYCYTDSKLICQYHLRDDDDFKLFEKVKLLGNPLFHAFHLLEDGTGAYVFDFAKQQDEFWKVTTGKYSTLDIKNKRKILSFFKSHSAHYAYIESYLEPKKYFPMYSEILNVKVKTLREVGELCSIPDLEKENLEIGIKIMSLSDNPLNLQQ